MSFEKLNGLEGGDKHLAAREEVFALLGRIDNTPTWQVLGAKYDVDEDYYQTDVVSRGDILPIDNEMFGDISEHVQITSDPEVQERLKVHLVHFEGDSVGFEMFVDTLAQEMAFEPENPTDMISQFVASNPYWLLGVL